jgi:hypothetical protein
MTKSPSPSVTRAPADYTTDTTTDTVAFATTPATSNATIVLGICLGPYLHVQLSQCRGYVTLIHCLWSTDTEEDYTQEVRLSRAQFAALTDSSQEILDSMFTPQ